MASVLGLAGLAVPALLVMAGVLLFSLLTGYVMHQLTKLDLATCLLASTPGGLTEMSLLSEGHLGRIRLRSRLCRRRAYFMSWRFSRQ